MTDGIVAQEQAARHERQRIGQARQDAEFARHVVSAGRQFTHRRTAQHRRLAVEMDQVVEVRQPAGELARRRIAIQPQPMRRQMRRQRIPIQRHALPGRAYVSGGLLHCSIAPN